MSQLPQIYLSSMESDDRVLYSDASSSSSSYRPNYSQSNISRISTSTAPSTTVPDEGLIARTYDAAKTLSHIKCPHQLRRDHLSSSFGSSHETTAFNYAYQSYAQTSHMGVLDPAYKVFVSQKGYGSLIYKLHARTVVVAGDPLCSEFHRKPLLDELRRYRWHRGLSLAFIGISENFAKYAQEQGWATMHFGHEAVFNPLTNKVLRKQAGKRTISQNKQLLDPKRGGISMNLYCPGHNEMDSELEQRLQKLYDDWREDRNAKHGDGSQAFVTVYDLFSHPEFTMFLYTTDRDGKINGLATLRELGAQSGYHLDPCIASQDAPRGISDLLLVTSMELLKASDISYMSLGFEPLDHVEEITGQSKVVAKLWKDSYNQMIQSVPVSGKSAYFKKFCPDESQTSKLFICMPSRGIPIRRSIALMQFANMNVGQLFSQIHLGERNKDKPTSEGQ
ncbi:phosphatidylglycerol lysyltransferase [Fusarium beomiforme]|uniref:Phosphatidylglycerol lysyltransferase n=1 Tax=Fusarium beomiforme TaxID=44412 RepID=A0A9P5AKD9_9HYPO|nr:phosphatidylglycerol lysyltransferase [Fusarium beomiforme]